ncbi:hypothetical protein HZS61_011608 [Fusarium oxysporum f. sp. conglutinans]|uniref:Peroxisomal short-chain alcohol dehydrogenase n=1 Tax=Fusarium oxysporum f. sp. conglutinans TaxID=100902 RepID=A0A8H6LN27_FUSOX|nr:hypothetical protein HZS61_011608 [Fusarium oxysporum f. sp. conglutinans]
MSLPTLNGRTVVITGGNSGIGYAIARGFIKADAARVSIIGRRKDVVVSAASKLQDEARQLGKQAVVQGRTCDISDLSSTADFWGSLQSEGIFVDVLLLNAAAFGAGEPILQGGLSKVWGDFESNVRSTLDMTERSYKQQTTETARPKFLVNISTCAAYMWTTMGPERPTYGLTKNASTLLLQQIAKDTKPNDMQVVSFHPGGVLTESAKRVGGKELKKLVFDDGKNQSCPLLWSIYTYKAKPENLPGHFAVRAASSETSFLYGRFVWANWDVDELKSGPVGEQIDSDEHFLKVGVEGLSEKMGGMLMS